VGLAEACRSDVAQLCAEEPEGAVLGCLHRNRKNLSKACRAEEVRMDVMQASAAAACSWRSRGRGGWGRSGICGQVQACLLQRWALQAGPAGACLPPLSASLLARDSLQFGLAPVCVCRARALTCGPAWLLPAAMSWPGTAPTCPPAAATP
jgi:hypothetical protein